MKENEIKSTQVENINEGFEEYLKDQNVKAYYSFDRFEFMAPGEEGLGLGENNILVVEREIEGKDGKKITVFDFYKDGINIANTNENGEIIFTDEYKKILKSINKDYYAKINIEKRKPKTISKDDLEKKLQEEEQARNNEDHDKDDTKDKKKEDNSKEKSKQEEPKVDEKDKNNKEALKKALGDKYTYVSEINDKEVSEEFSRKEGIVGNPYMAYNSETKEFVVIGTNQNGKIIESNMLRTKSITNVDKYDKQGNMKETTINGLMFIRSQDKDAFSIEINNYGEMEINKVINARTDHPQVLPVDTKQTVPTSKEIDEMKQKSNIMNDIEHKLESLEADGLLTHDEVTRYEEKMSKDMKDPEENLAELEAIENAKRDALEKEQDDIDKDIEDLTKENDSYEYDDDDGMPPMADPYNPNKLSRW